MINYMTPISRPEAKKLGRSEYFTGLPCKRGHIAARWVHSYSCVSCHAEQSATHRKTTKSKQTRHKIYTIRQASRPWDLMTWSAQRHARDHNVPFDLTPEYVKTLWPLNGKCPALGIDLLFGKDTASPNSPSIDRLIPELGYIKTNVAIISMRANRIKSDAIDPAELRMVADWLESRLTPCIKGND